jgi:adenosine kinase
MGEIAASLMASLVNAPGRDDDMLTKYGLKANDAILAEAKHLGIYEDILQNRNATLVAGGAAQNTARGAQVGLKVNNRPLLSG